jgi:hypothetical protein
MARPFFSENSIWKFSHLFLSDTWFIQLEDAREP